MYQVFISRLLEIGLAVTWMLFSITVHGYDLIPPLATASPRLRFHAGQVRNNRPLILRQTPLITYPVSPFYIVQWQQPSYILPNSLREDDSATYIPGFGTAKFSFQAPDGHAHVWIFSHEGSWVYELYESGGLLRQGGGSNLFISSDRFISSSLGGLITVDFDAKLSRANITGAEEAKDSGSVLAHVFAGFELLYTDPLSGARLSLFMQIPIADSSVISRHAILCCDAERVTLFSPTIDDGEPILEFRDDLGPLKHFHYKLNGYIQEFAKIAPRQAWPTATLDLRNWKISGFYIGLETNSVDQRLSVSRDKESGYVEVGLLIANIALTSDPTQK